MSLAKAKQHDKPEKLTTVYNNEMETLDYLTFRDENMIHQQISFLDDVVMISQTIDDEKQSVFIPIADFLEVAELIKTHKLLNS